MPKKRALAMTWICLFAVLLLLLTGCPGRTPLPQDPGMLYEDFGLGIALGMPVEDAVSNSKATSNCEIEVVSRDEMSRRAPYDSAVNSRDKVLVIHQQVIDMDEAAGSFTGDIVSEVRCYLADPVLSVVELAGQPAAKLTEAGAKQAFGEPVQVTATGDNEVHYTYYFALPDQPAQMLELVLSFHNSGYCFALALALKQRVK